MPEPPGLPWSFLTPAPEKNPGNSYIAERSFAFSQDDANQSGHYRTGTSYSGHLALGSKLMMVCGGAVGTIGRRYGLPDALWHE